jgi:sensor c-di-GMP phosphodiesterase-like protein
VTAETPGPAAVLVVDDDDGTRALVADALRRAGFVVLESVSGEAALDSYASLRHILELRPTYAKLDSSLVHGIDGDDLRQALAAGLQYFASKTGCRLIAEGVESRAEADVLTRLGITFGQGDLFGRPELAA